MLNCRTLVTTTLIALLLSTLTFPTLSDDSSVACQMDNKAMQAMHDGVVTIATEQGRQVQLKVKIADNNYTRGQGFQRVCAERIAALPILFLFGVKALPSFHMNNVVAPIDIAFISADGSIDSIHAMLPYPANGDKPRYKAKAPVVGALEVAPGFFDKNLITASSIITWEEVAR